jgi:Xaa-Pro aminopeptidase
MNAAECRRRRERLMQRIGQRSVAVLPSARIAMRNRNIQYPYRQDSDFYYLSGFTEPDAVLVLIPGRAHGEVILFCAERDPLDELWHGERIGPERAVVDLGVDDAFPIADLPDILPGMLEQSERIYVELGRNAEFEHELIAWVSAIRRRRESRIPEFAPLSHALHDLRLIKSPAEQRLLRQAAAITADAHVRAMCRAAPGFTEADLEAELMHEFISRGARHPAYPPIVAAGANACVLHYARNEAPLRDGDLVLIDAGCEFQHYAADVTRTFPVNGRFTAPQRDLYEIVLAAQQRALAAVVPGAACNEPHAAALDVLIDGLRVLGLLAGSRAEIEETRAYARFCAASSSHWLGLDVHDVGEYRIDSAWREFTPGMVLTIEPGVYVPDAPDLPVRWRGMGIRIEDAVVVTRHGHDVLTGAAPKEIADIQAVMGGPPRRRRARSRGAVAC